MTSRSKGPILIAAVSGRQLAEAARASGYVPLVADAFGDDDTRAAAEAVEVVPGSDSEGLNLSALAVSLEKLAQGRKLQLVTGAGFEAGPEFLARYDVAGNGAETVSRVKDVEGFAAACLTLGIPHPEIRVLPPASSDVWLTKRAGASGGEHISLGAKPAEAGLYYQKHVDGMPVSALFAADGENAQILGYSRQWCSPTPEAPFRWGGAVQPSGLPDSRLKPLGEAVAALTRYFALKGINSADFIVGDREWWLLEINPRPGATLDLFLPVIPDLFERHMAAARGRLLPAAALPRTSIAHAVVYAMSDIARVPAISWPLWARDREAAGHRVAAGAPLCSVRGEGAAAMDAIAETTARSYIIRAQLEGRAA